MFTLAHLVCLDCGIKGKPTDEIILNMRPSCKACFCHNLFWKVLNLACLLIVLSQTFLNIMDSFNSGKTVTTYEIRKFEDKEEIPLTFNIIVRPGFDDAKLLARGYLNVNDYLLGGASKINSSVVGWAGHGKNESNVTGEIR